MSNELSGWDKECEKSVEEIQRRTVRLLVPLGFILFFQGVLAGSVSSSKNYTALVVIALFAVVQLLMLYSQGVHAQKQAVVYMAGLWKKYNSKKDTEDDNGP